MKKTLWMIGCLLIVATMHRYSQFCGIGKTYDSINYVWASNTFIEKGILENKDGVLFLQQPPLFPLILSLSKPNQALFASWLNTFCLLGIVYIWLVLGGKVLENNILWCIYAICLACATPLYLIHQFLWSEPVFLLLVSFQFWIFEQYVTHKKAFLWWLMVLCGFLFCLQRSIGITFVLGTCCGLYLILKEHWYRVLVYFLTSCAGVFVWLLYVLRYKTASEFVGTYGIQEDSWAGIKILIESFGLWFLPTQALWVGKAGVAMLLLFLVGKTIFSYSSKQEKVPLFLQNISYAILFYVLILCFKKSDFSDTERFVAILYPFILILLFYHLPTQKYYAIVLICVSLVTVYPVVRCVKNVLFWKKVQCKD